MKCPECVKAGQKSKVYTGYGTTTTMFCPSFYDEEGKFHSHDTNRRSMTYACSNGHSWVAEEANTCQCGWSSLAPDKSPEHEG